jgi:hypothetical protein
MNSWGCSGRSVSFTVAWPLAGDVGDQHCGDQCGIAIITGELFPPLGQEALGSKHEAHLLLVG